MLKSEIQHDVVKKHFFQDFGYKEVSANYFLHDNLSSLFKIQKIVESVFLALEVNKKHGSSHDLRHHSSTSILVIN